MKTMLIFILLGIYRMICAPEFTNLKNDHVPSENRANLDSFQIKSHPVRVVFWNVENLYDPYDDTTKLDDEFTASGTKHWGWSRFSLKLNRVAKTFISVGGWTPPVIVGLCEVENRYVLNKLVFTTPLKYYNYKFIHHESPDQRGVDVAMLYRPSEFHIIENRTVSIRFPFDTISQTREILCVKGILFGKDTLFVFINHWPSRRGGYLSSQPRRNYVAAVLARIIDSVKQVNRSANILIMGDFNDEPENESLLLHLKGLTEVADPSDSLLYNLIGIRNKKRKEGTLKYRDQWSTFDQFLVSGAILKGTRGIKTSPGAVEIVRSSFLLEEDQTYFGEKLFRTYAGPKYRGGFSDHLPISIELYQVNTDDHID